MTSVVFVIVASVPVYLCTLNVHKMSYWLSTKASIMEFHKWDLPTLDLVVFLPHYDSSEANLRDKIAGKAMHFIILMK